MRSPASSAVLEKLFGLSKDFLGAVDYICPMRRAFGFCAGDAFQGINQSLDGVTFSDLGITYADERRGQLSHKPGQYDDGQLRMIQSELFSNLIARHARHFVIQDDGINGFTPGYFKACRAIFCGEDGVTLALKELLA